MPDIVLVMKNMNGIYVPGLGDERAMGQDAAVRDFAKYSIDFAYHPVNWGDKEPWVPKLARLNDHVSELHEQNGGPIVPVSYTHLTLPTNREV